MPNKGLLIVLSGPSGAGKDTVLKKLMKEQPNIKLSVSATTRSPRPGEKHGKDYYFITHDEFNNLINNDNVLEYANYCDNFYGTPKKPVNDWLDSGCDVILEIEVKGGAQVRKTNPNSIGIFIIPPSFEVLKKRLINRKTESESVINERLSTAKIEIKSALDYDYIVVNDSLDECVKKIKNIIKSEKMKAFRMKYILEECFYNE